MESESHLEGNQNQCIPSCHSYHPLLWQWNVDNLSTAYKEAKPLLHAQSEEDSQHHMAKTHPRHQSFNLGFSSQYLHHHDEISFIGPVMLSTWKITASWRNCSMVNCLRTSTPKETRRKFFKDTLKVSIKSFGIIPNCLEYLVHDRSKWHEVIKQGAQVCETRRNVATELCRKLGKSTAATIPCSHCPRLFHAYIGLISHWCTHRWLPHYKVDQMVLIDYNGQRRTYCFKYSNMNNFQTNLFDPWLVGCFTGHLMPNQVILIKLCFTLVFFMVYQPL